MRSHKQAVHALAVVLSAAALAQSQPQPVDESLAAYADTMHSVTLADARKIHFVCMGEGSPTVILTAGLGEWALSWSKVQPAIARTTRVCAWDRPGFGLSDASSVSRTVAATTADLEEALASGGPKGPYVIVGHSLGAYESLLFTDRHQDAVVGMVLVDPSIPDQFAQFARVAPLIDEQLKAGIAAGVARMRKCAADMRDGTVAPGKPDPSGCLPPFPPAYPLALREAITTLRSPERFETAASINSSLAESGALVVNSARNYGDLPLIVLTATDMGSPPPEATPDFLAQGAAWIEVFNLGHDELAALSTRGVNARVPGATHAIQQVKPHVVIDAIVAIVAQARAAPAGD
jgi:pimeloyl-ACP methyl ester carboxylesterase